MLLAGSFGAYLTPLSAVRIGLVPRMALPRIVSAGNVAGEGAKIAALSLRERAEAAVDPARGASTSSCRAAPTSTTCSSTSSPSRDDRRRSPTPRPRRGGRLRRAGASTCARSPAGAAGTIDVVPVPRCCTTARADRAGGRRAALASHDVVARGLRATAAPTARWTSPGGPGVSGWPATTATTCFAATRSSRRCAEEPGTYFLTDFLARTFEHTVVRELGLDRQPELRDDYFRHYTRVVWLAQRPTPATRRCAEARGRAPGAAAGDPAGGQRGPGARARAAPRRLTQSAAPASTSSVATSATRRSAPTLCTPSSSITVQNGQATASVQAPVRPPRAPGSR